MTDAARRTSSWSHEVEKTKYATKNSGLKPDRGYIGHKAAKMMKRSKSIMNRQQSAIAEKSKLLKNIERSDSLKISQFTYHQYKLAELDKVAIFYGETMVCQDVSFTIERGDRIALLGKNGSGKSSILRLIRGEDLKFTGTLRRGSQLKISYVSQDIAQLEGNLTEYAVK